MMCGVRLKKVVELDNDFVVKSFLLEATLAECVNAAGGSTGEWSRWFNGSRDIKVSSLFEPAKRLGISPGELLDVILERRKRHLEYKKEMLETQIEKGLPDPEDDFSGDAKGWLW